MEAAQSETTDHWTVDPAVVLVNPRRSQALYSIASRCLRTESHGLRSIPYQIQYRAFHARRCSRSRLRLGGVSSGHVAVVELSAEQSMRNPVCRLGQEPLQAEEFVECGESCKLVVDDRSLGKTAFTGIELLAHEAVVVVL